MADKGSIHNPYSGGAVHKENIVIDVSGEGIKQLEKLGQLLDKISKNTSLIKFFKTQDQLILQVKKHYDEYNESRSKDDAHALLASANALKALTNNNNINEIITDIDHLDDVLNAVVKRFANNPLDSAFSVDSFKEYFKLSGMLSNSLASVFNNVVASDDVAEMEKKLVSLNSEVKELNDTVSTLKVKLNDAGASNYESLLTRLRDEAQETFEAFLRLNNISTTSYITEDYFESIKEGYLTANEAIRQFKNEYGHLLTDNTNSGVVNDSDILISKLNTILEKVEEISSKVREIMTDGVKSNGLLSGLDDPNDIEKISAILNQIVTKSTQSQTTLFNEEQLDRITTIFGNIEDHLLQMRKIIADVGDGEEFSPLLKMIDELKKSISGIGDKLFNNTQIDELTNKIKLLEDEIVAIKTTSSTLLSSTPAVESPISSDDDFEFLIDDDILDDLDLDDLTDDLEEITQATRNAANADEEYIETREKLESLLSSMGVSSNEDEIIKENSLLENQRQDVVDIEEALNLLSEKYIKLTNIIHSAQDGWDGLSDSTKDALKQLKLFDENGNFLGSFNEQGMAATGALMNGEHAIIARRTGTYDRSSEYYNYGTDNYLELLIKKEQEAYDQGVNLARILSVIDGYDGIYEIQEQAKGEQVHDISRYSTLESYLQKCRTVTQATDEQLDKLLQDAIKLNELGFKLDFGVGNILYDENNGFSFIDLELRELDEEIPKTEELVRGLFRCLAGGELIDTSTNNSLSNFTSDDNLQRLTAMLSVAERLQKVFDVSNVPYLSAIQNAHKTVSDSLNKTNISSGDTTTAPLQEVETQLGKVKEQAEETAQSMELLYHNSDKVFDKFDDKKVGSNQGGVLGRGFYLSTDPDEYNKEEYGIHQTQWKANKKLNLFNIQDKSSILSDDEINKIISDYLGDIPDVAKESIKKKLKTIGLSAIDALNDIGKKSGRDGVDSTYILSALGFDGIKDGKQINIFNGSNISRANDIVKSLSNKTPVLAEQDVTSQTEASTAAVNGENEALGKIPETAKEAAEAKEKFAEANKKVSDSAEESSEAVNKERKALGALIQDVKEFDESSFKTRDIISQSGFIKTYTQKDDKGNDIEVGAFSFTERLQDGQIQNVLVEYDAATQKWMESVVSVDTAFEKVGKEVMSLDKKISKATIAMEKQKVAHPDYDTSADEAYIRLLKDGRAELLDILRNVYSEKEEYAYKDNEFKRKRIENSRLLQQELRKERELLRVKQDESDAKAAEKQAAAITQANRALNNYEKKIAHIRQTYDKAANPDLEKAVTNPDSLNRLEMLRQALVNRIKSLENSPRDASNERLYLNLEKMIAYYDDLAKAKKRADNPTKGELGGKNLEVLYATQVNDLDKLILKAKEYGDASKYLVEILEKEKAAIIQKHDVDKKYAADDYYNTRDLLTVSKSDLSYIAEIEKNSDKWENIFDNIRGAKEASDNLIFHKDLHTEFTNAIIGISDLNDKLEADKITIQEHRKEVEKLIDEYEEMYNIQIKRDKEQYDAKYQERNNKALKIANTLTRKYDELRKVQATGTATEQQVKHLERIKGYIDTLKNSGILDEKQIDAVNAKLAATEKSIAKIMGVDGADTQINSLLATKGIDRDSFDASGFGTKLKELNDQLAQEGVNGLDKYKAGIREIINELNKIPDNSFVGVENDIESATAAAHKVSNDFNGGSRIIEQGMMTVKNGIGTMTETVRTADGQVHKLQYTYVNGMLSMRDVTKKVKTELSGLPRLFQALGDKWKQLATYWVANQLNPYDFINIFKRGFNIIRELDDALVDLQKTTAMNSSELNGFYNSSNDIAKQMGVTTKAIIEQSSAWSRLGYNTAETSGEMAKLSSQFASISPGMTTDEATTGLVSTMKAFDIEVDDVERKILDNINTLGNNFALNNQDLITGLQHMASAMAATGASIEETMAIFTGAQEVIQDSSQVGAAIKSFSMRIRGMDEEGEYLDEVKNIKGDVYNLTNGKVSIMQDENTFRPILDILRDISKEWDNITDKNRAELLEKLFAKTRANVGAAVITNFDAVEDALKEMQSASGSADHEMSIIEKSISFKLNKLKETWVGFVQDTASREGVGNIIDMLTDLSEAIIKLADSGMLLPTVIGGLSAFTIFKNKGKHIRVYVFQCR